MNFTSHVLNDSEIFELSEMTYRLGSPLIGPNGVVDVKLLNGHSLDLRLGCQIKRQDFTPNDYIEENMVWGDKFTIQPQEFLLAHTAETITLPEDILGKVEGKSSIARLGIQVQTSNTVNAGFAGEITLELFNQSRWPVTLKVGMPICQISFIPVKAPMKSYSKVGRYHLQKGAHIPCNLF